MTEELFINNIYIPLSKSINPSITRSIAEIQEPNKRKSTYSKNIFIADSVEMRKVVGQIHDINNADGFFNPTLKADVLYLVDGLTIINGYCQLKVVKETDGKEIGYNMVLFGNVASLFASIGSKFLTDLDLSQWNHPFDKQVQEDSWATQVFDSTIPGFVPFALGKGYVYALVDYGFSSDSITYNVNEIGVSIYFKEYWDRIFADAGFTYSSAFLNTNAFKALILPASPETYALTQDEIVARLFSANTPTFTSTGTTVSNNLPLESFSADDVIIFGNDISDPSGLYNNGNGQYTVVESGFYDLNALVEVNGIFSPDTQPAVTTSEIKAKIKIKLNGGILDEIPIFITRDSASAFSDYPYTTDTTPTYPDVDYRSDTKYPPFSWNPTFDVPRNFNPPDRYLASASGVFLTTGDVVEIAVAAGFFNGFEPSYYNSGGGSPTPITGNAQIIISVGAFFNKVNNATLVTGNTFLASKAVPLNFKQKDFIMNVVKMHNLYIDVDPNNAKNLIIEPRDAFYLDNKINIEKLIALDKGIEQLPMGLMNARRYLYTYKKDKDYYNDKYNTRYNESYGQREVTAINEFVQKIDKNELTLSPTPIVGLPNNDRVVSTIIAVDDLNQAVSTKHNPRVLYYGGLKDNFENWIHTDGIVPTSRTQYPYAGHFDDPFNPTLDINFGLVKEVYYDDNLSPIIVTNNNLFNKHWLKTMAEITDRDSRLVKVWVNVSHKDFNGWSFRNQYWFNNAFHRLNKIGNFNPTNENLTRCEFIKIKLQDEFVPLNEEIQGDAAQLFTLPQGGILPGEQVPIPNSKTTLGKDDNNYKSNTVQIKGSNNFVSKRAEDVCIKGDDNKVFESKQILLDNSFGNTILAGLRNVTLINTRNVTVTESFVTYINGRIKGSVETVTVNTTLNREIETYLVDTTAGDITMGLPDVGIERGDTWDLKKIVQANKMILRTATKTIDGVTILNFKSKNTNITPRYDGDNYIII